MKIFISFSPEASIDSSYFHLMIKREETRILTLEQREQVRCLWNREYPVKIALKDGEAMNAYLDSLGNPKHKLLYKEEDKLVGWYVDFDRDDHRWFAVILDASLHGKGIGSMLMSEAKAENKALFGWAVMTEGLKKTDGSIYRPSIGFYKKFGFSIFDDEIFETEIMTTVKVGIK